MPKISVKFPPELLLMILNLQKFRKNIFQKTLICDKISDIYYRVAFGLERQGVFWNMAISYKSKLYDSERIFTIAAEWYKDRPLYGVLYQGNQQTGVCFTGYHELAWQMERCFAQMQYPRSVMDMRELRSGRAEVGQRDDAEMARRDDGADIYTIRVTQRQNASWQGSVRNPAGEVLPFGSFLDLVSCLESDLSGCPEREGRDREACQQRVEHYLQIVMNGSEVMKVLPDTLVYRFRREGRRQTFMIHPMFYEHGSCQGTVYWKEHRRQVSFRSFLELISMMGAAIRDQSCWDEQEEAI